MDDALLVRGLEGVADLLRILNCGPGLDWSIQRTAFQVFHHQVVGTDVIQGAHVGVIERGDRMRFATKSVGVRSDEPLDRNAAAETRINRAIDFPHTTSSDEADELIRTEQGAWRQRHGMVGGCRRGGGRSISHES